MKFHIVGIHKCGTVSLKQFLESQGHIVFRDESMFWDGGVNAHYEKYPNSQVVFILRDPIDRMWSHYWYKRHHQKGDRLEIKCDLEEALEKHDELWQHCDYKYWLEIWKETKPFVFWLECLQQFVPGFPKENVSPDKPKPTTNQLVDMKLKLKQYKILK